MARPQLNDDDVLTWLREAAPRILVVEDHPGIAQILTTTIGELGCTIAAVVEDSQQALEAARTLGPAAAFVDINLADGPTGCDVAEALSRQYRMPVVLITSDPEKIPATFPHALALVEKPLRPDRIVLALTLIARTLSE